MELLNIDIILRRRENQLSPVTGEAKAPSLMKKGNSKGELRRMRKAGLIPGVVYSKGSDALDVAVKEKEFRMMAARAKPSQLFILKSENGVLNDRRALVREVQRNYLSGKILHIDLNALREDEDVKVDVVLEVIGEPPGVKLEGGVLSFVKHYVKVACFPKDIPEKFIVDVSALRLNQSVHAGDISLPVGVKLVDNKEETLVTVIAVRSSEAAGEVTPSSGTPSPAAAPSKGGAAPSGGKGGAPSKAPAGKK